MLTAELSKDVDTDVLVQAGQQIFALGLSLLSFRSSVQPATT